jgi:hypothetical protein
VTAPLSPYELLGVELTATAADVQRAFKDALRARKHPPQQVRHAYEQLRHARSRLRHDLLEPEATDPRARLDALPAGVTATAAADEGLPAWGSLVRPELGAREVVERPVAPPERSFTNRAGPAPRDVVPPFEFPELS